MSITNRKNIGNTYKKWLELKTKIKYKDDVRYFNVKFEEIKENEIISSSYIQSRCEYADCCEIWKKKMPDLFECENFCCSTHAKLKGLEKKIKTQRENLEFKKSFSSEEKSKFWSKDNIDEDGKYIDPRYIHKKSGFKFLFECNDCKHKFKKSCAKVSDGEWCPFCNSNSFCDSDECNFCLDKSILSYKNNIIIIHPEKNKDKELRKIARFSHIDLYWLCKTCNHDFKRSCKDLHGCPFCSNKELCDYNKCKICLEKSAASLKSVNNCWDYSKNKESPRFIFKGTDRLFWFNCRCGHNLERSLTKCKYCGLQSLCEDKNCIKCYNKSFASINDNYNIFMQNNINPRMIFKNSAKKYLLKCIRCSSLPYKKSLREYLCCKNCHNKTEKKIYDFLINSYQVVHGYYREWCKNKNNLPFDLCIEELKIIVECDGPQHFKQVSNWNPFEETQETDIYKMKCANNNGFSVIRIVQEDVFHDKYDWQKELLENINKIKEGGIVQNIYMCKNDEYNNHLQLSLNSL